MSPSLSLRNLQIPHAPHAHHVMFDGLPVGTISASTRAHNEIVWKWAIYETEYLGEGENLDHCLVLFKEAWRKFSKNPERLAEYLAERIYQETGRAWNRPTNN